MKALFAIALLCLAIIGGAQHARAHAVLVESTPADGALLDTAPTAIVLRFNEPVAAVFLRLLDGDGRSLIAPETVQTIDREIRAALPAPLGDGSYIVSYRAVSSDSHPIGGALAFSIGDTAVQLDAPEDDGTSWLLVKIALSLLQHIALLSAAGGVLFRWLVLRGAALPHLRGLIVGSAAVAIAATILQIGAQGALLGLADLSRLFDPAIWSLGIGTTLGTSAAFIVPALIVLCIPTGSWVAVAAALVAAGGLALTGHSAAAGSAARMLQGVHAIAAAYWVGSLIPLMLVLRHLPADRTLDVTRRFSTFAIPVVLALLVAGVASIPARGLTLDDLLSGEYGQKLFVKLLFVGLLLLLALHNRYRLTRANGVSWLRVGIGIEIGIATFVLIATAFLAHTPPRAAEDHRHDSAMTPGEGFAVVTTSRDIMLFIEMRPSRAGQNDFELRFSQADGKPFAVREVSLELFLPERGIEPLIRRAARADPGHYYLAGVPLSPAGEWHLRIDALVSDFDKLVFETRFPVR